MSRLIPLLPLASLLLLAAPISRADEPERPWTLTLNGGGQFTDHDSAAPNGGVTLARTLGNHLISAGIDAARTEADANAVNNNVPSTTIEGRLGYGYQYERYSFGLHAVYGRRSFDSTTVTIANPLPGRPARDIRSTADGSQYGGGASFSADFDAGPLLLTPHLGVDWNRTDTATVRNRANGTNTEIASDQESGVTGTFGATLSHRFSLARSLPAQFSLDAAWLVASNGSAIDASTRAGTRLASSLSQTAGSNGHQSWGEFGATLSLDLTASTSLDFDVVRSVSFAPDDYTAVGAALSIRF